MCKMYLFFWGNSEWQRKDNKQLLCRGFKVHLEESQSRALPILPSVTATLPSRHQHHNFNLNKYKSSCRFRHPYKCIPSFRRHTYKCIYIRNIQFRIHFSIPFPFPWAKLGYNGEKWLKHEKGENGKKYGVSSSRHNYNSNSFSL